MILFPVILGVVTSIQFFPLVAERKGRGHKPGRERPAVEEVISIMKDTYALMDIDDDSILDCLTARRVQYDPEEWSVTYLWDVSGSTGTRLKFTVHAWAGDTPDTCNYTASIKPGQFFTGHAAYFDHKGCLVLEMPHLGDQCTLWVTKEIKDSVPNHCMKQFADICGNGVSLHDKDTCKDVDESAFLDSLDDA